MNLSKRKYKVAAWLIDFIIITLICLVVFFATSSFDFLKYIFQRDESTLFNIYDIYRIGLTFIFIVVCLIGYLVFIPFFSHGQTLGMWVLK